MDEKTDDDHREIEKIIVGLYNILYEDDLTTDDIKFYELEEEKYEGEVYLPYIGLNVSLWQDWTTEKRVEVLIHEFAHTEDYEDDHHPDFWERVVELTEIAIDHQSEIEGLFNDDLDPEKLKQTVVDSIHEWVIEEDIDSVSDRKKAVATELGLQSEASD